MRRVNFLSLCTPGFTGWWGGGGGYLCARSKPTAAATAPLPDARRPSSSTAVSRLEQRRRPASGIDPSAPDRRRPSTDLAETVANDTTMAPIIHNGRLFPPARDGWQQVKQWYVCRSVTNAASGNPNFEFHPYFAVLKQQSFCLFVSPPFNHCRTFYFPTFICIPRFHARGVFKK